MDTLISSAIEEICSRGPAGLLLSSLWSTLTPTPSHSLKSSLWTNLLSIPSIQFTLNRNNTPVSPKDARIQHFEDAEKLNLKIVANEHLRNCFVGLYDVTSSALAAPQRRALNRIAVARRDGITQSQMAKEFGMEGKNLFYIVRNLECRGLIVRQPAVVKTKESNGEGETKNSVTTNLMYLNRYAKHLGIQQRFEINKEEHNMEVLENVEEADVGEDSFACESLKDDVLVKDYLPAMKAVCDKLEEADGKILVVSDIKRTLGYSGPFGHRAWRTVCRRLKDAGLIEEFEAKVNEKVERCIRLLKKFYPKNFETRTHGYGEDCDRDQLIKFGRRFQQTAQLVELPVDYQIYDMVNCEGTKGTTVMEVCEKLSLDRKRNDSRLRSVFSRFGMHVQAENHKKTVAFRVWTSNPEASVTSKIDIGKNKVSTSDVGNHNVLGGSTETFLDYNPSTAEVDLATPAKSNNREIDIEFSCGSPEDGKSKPMPLSPGHLPASLNEPKGSSFDAELDLVSKEMETDATPLQTTPTPSKLHISGSNQMYPYLPLTADGALREQRILERLKDEKFILRCELHRWLASFEKNKYTTIDRKTIDRILNKLQQEGHCKCVHINVPVVTNCGRSRIMMVIFHSSVQGFPPELLGEIHDRFRSFERQIRGHGSSRSKANESVPVLNGLIRTQNRVVSDDAAIRLEAMRANGYVLAKMVRAKLLHGFLWDYLSSTTRWDDVLASGTHGCSYKLFSLEETRKAIPIELFLQVVGFPKKLDNMIEKCKKGLCVSDLPVEEYKLLMNTQAVGRLSVIIDILRRLKLIRVIRDGHLESGDKVSCATFTYAMELKPYIEEPLSVFATSTLGSLDFRPRIRHDFVLSSRQAVDEYWKTLEYCFAVADPRAAIHSFPGSAVPEVFVNRSWASIRAMSAGERSELLKCIMKHDLNRKMSYEQCEKIAKDLDVTLYQVLRVCNDKHYKCLNRFQGVVDTHEDECQSSNKKLISPSKKRKRNLESSSVKRVAVDVISEQLSEQRFDRIPDTLDQSMEEPLEEYDDHLATYQKDGHLQAMEEPGLNEAISPSAFSKMNPIQKSRFGWTDEADRHMIIQYVRHRATLGVKVQRLDWSKVPDLPAPPKTCSRRMAALNRNLKFRKALMKLCTVVSELYAKFLEKMQSIYPNNNDYRTIVRCSKSEGLDRNSSGVEDDEDASCQEQHWDDFDGTVLKKALEEVLYHKGKAKIEAPRREGSAFEELSDLHMNVKGYNHRESKLVSSRTPYDNVQSPGMVKLKDSARRSRCHPLDKKFAKILHVGTSVSGQVHESLAASNAVELLKLVFLSTSTSPKLQNLIADTLRRYSEHDLFAAFSYLREKRIMIGDNGGPFVLSQHFMHNVSRSPFPANTGKRAAKFSDWLHEKEKDLMEGGVHLSEDLQCGETFQLFALVSSGELSISPCMPGEGVGEAEDLRSLKRKAEDDEMCDGDKLKKMKSLADSELISRREKGFPGIMISVHRTTMLVGDAVGLFKDVKTCIGELHRNDDSNAILGLKISCSSSTCDHMRETLDFDSVVPAAEWSSESPWEAMACYAEYLTSKPSDLKQSTLFIPEVFRSVHTAIQKAGDQGLSIEEVSQVAGENMCEHIIDVLQAFGRVLKVNAYNSARIVDAFYRSKYFLTSLSGFHQDHKPYSATRSSEICDDGHPVSQAISQDVVGANPQMELIMNNNDVHKVTILNLPEEAVALNENQSCDMHEGCSQDNVVIPGQTKKGGTHEVSSAELHVPILPWINGDGTINKAVYHGLTRRVLGIVMQYPGILEDNIIHRIDALNPQSCRSLLELMILDKHLIVREMCQASSCSPPALLGPLLGNSFGGSKMVYRKHFFANPLSASSL